MTLEEADKYWFRARRTVYTDLGKVALFGSEELAMLLGLPYTRTGAWQDIPLTDDLKFKLKVLAGPHSKTFVRILMARRAPPAV